MCSKVTYIQKWTERTVPTSSELAKTESVAAADEGEAEDTGPRILSKKEKEKLKKEREKVCAPSFLCDSEAQISLQAKKKAQAVAKKESHIEDTAAEIAPAVEAADQAGADEEGDEEGTTGAASKKKKKKKAKKDDEPAPTPAAAKKKAASGISVLKAMMEEKKRLEEEARRREEEERKRIEEEERKAEEEAKKKEEEKQRRKEKEKVIGRLAFVEQRANVLWCYEG